jgi:hypothetical protein
MAMTNLATTIAPICLLAAGTALAADKALVIGIDDYPGVALPRPLSTAADDARAMRDHLVADLGFAAEDVTLLTDGAATAEGIVGALLADLVGGTSEGDRALVYFAGLGGRIATSDAAEIDAYEEYLLAHGDGDPFALIPEGALIELLDRLEGRAVTVIIDASMTAPRMSVLRDGDAVAPRAAAFGASEVASRNVADADLGALGRETFMESPFGAGRGAAGGAAPSGHLGLAGNAREWVVTEEGGALKGGSWNSTDPGNLRGAARLAVDPGTAGVDFGFRCARDLEEWP